MPKLTKKETIKKCQDLAMENYEKGMDAIVECWGDKDWETLYTNCKGSYNKMVEAMREDADCWVEKNQNARWGEDSDPCMFMLDSKPEEPRAKPLKSHEELEQEYLSSLTPEELAQHESCEAEYACGLMMNGGHTSRADGMMGYNSYEECCNAHAIGLIDMDETSYF